MQLTYPETSPWIDAVLWNGLAPDAEDLRPSGQDVEIAAVQRLAPLALDLHDRRQQPLPTPAEDVLRRSDFAWSTWTSAVQSAGRSATELLNANGLRTVVFKGPVTRKLYRQERFRPFGDIDILVERHDAARGRALFTQQGWFEEDDTAMPYPFMDRWCREAQNIRRGDTERIDLHQRVPPWLWTDRIRFDELFESGHGSGLSRDLNGAWSLIVASLHLVSDRGKPGQTLLIWRDLAELSADVDARAVSELAASVGLASWLRTCLCALPAAVRPERVIAALPASQPRHALRLWLLSRPRVIESHAPLGQVLRLPVPRALAFAAGMLLPPRRYLDRRYGQISKPYRTWWFGADHVH